MEFEQYFFNKKYINSNWQMEPGEKAAMLYILNNINSEISIEIGTSHGGSLRPISDFSQKVYSFDLDHNYISKLDYDNVEFITGNSKKSLPKIIKELNKSIKALEFVLIDGDHSKHGVKKDIENILEYKPKKPLYILMHDSFHPNCRSGILEANWNKSPYVHFVEVDFVHGTFHQIEDFYKEMWGGFSLALLLPKKRTSKLSISQSQELMFKSMLKSSVHNF
jgi:cephalosporin hydroxylase